MGQTPMRLRNRPYLTDCANRRDDRGMRNAKQLQAALGRITNLSEFARIHKLPLRTLCRLRVDARRARVGTIMRVNAALDK